VPGVQEPQLEVAFKQIVDGLPIDSCCFHAHQLDLEGAQPVSEFKHSPSGCGEPFDLLMIGTTALSGDLHARNDRRLMHVEPAAAFDDPLHLSPFGQGTLPSPRGASFQRNLVFVLFRQQFGVPEVPASH
jgi:hypothetical protein